MKSYDIALIGGGTGMRIGELLSTKVGEVNLPEKRIEIYQAHKNLTGRVVYLNTDAQAAI